MTKIDEITKILGTACVPHTTEEEMQAYIAGILANNGLPFEKEKTLGAKCRVDFFVGGIVIECKTKGNAIQIHRQLERYAAFPEVEGIVLYTSKFMRVQPIIKGKPAIAIQAGASWL